MRFGCARTKRLYNWDRCGHAAAQLRRRELPSGAARRRRRRRPHCNLQRARPRVRGGVPDVLLPAARRCRGTGAQDIDTATSLPASHRPPHRGHRAYHGSASRVAAYTLNPSPSVLQGPRRLGGTVFLFAHHPFNPVPGAICSFRPANDWLTMRVWSHIAQATNVCMQAGPTPPCQQRRPSRALQPSKRGAARSTPRPWPHGVRSRGDRPAGRL